MYWSEVEPVFEATYRLLSQSDSVSPDQVDPATMPDPFAIYEPRELPTEARAGSPDAGR